MNIDAQNEKDYEKWLKTQGISRAEHSRRVNRLVHDSPEMLRYDLDMLKTRLLKKWRKK